jgi:hypothetical protein
LRSHSPSPRRLYGAFIESGRKMLAALAVALAALLAAPGACIFLGTVKG